MEYPIKHKESGGDGMFYMEDDEGIVSEMTYTQKDNGIMVIDHTKTRKNLEGNGLASKVLDHVVNFARENSIKIDPLCPFVEAKFDEIESYQDVRV
ncbi:MAG TPA: GNAT family N-acetyltransferase [Flavobacteriaceae bacterium]|nr:GNAT family N-acetyltransferase [Flavobacteriaceae bacterium]